MVVCTRKGCGKEFDVSKTDDAACSFHPGAPVFHEGLKSWSCCSSVNKPVTSFDEFVAIPGCASGSHSSEKPVEAPKPAVAAPAPTTTNAAGQEVYGAAASAPSPLPAAPTPPPTAPSKPQSTIYVEEQDDPDVAPTKGTTCKRKACGVSYDGESREGEVCSYHPGAPIFHEGSKGYSCCKPRHLDFDDFLKIKGCRTGKHLFVGAKRDEEKEELV
ncbi:CORD and CS domain containing protein, partial [Pseudohyphozyma bogoriensis]